MRRSLLAAIAVIGLLLTASAAATAAPVVDGVFDLPQPSTGRLALDPAGNVWVTLDSAAPDLARVAPDGTVTPFTTGQFNFPKGIVLGPDGNMWITMLNNVGRFNPNNPLDATKTFTASIGSANGIVVGQDGNLWTGSDGNVVRITPTATPTITPFASGVTNFSAREIASASDGKLWTANGDGNNPGVLPMTLQGAAGAQVNASTTGAVQGVAAGPNGQIAYTQPNADPQRIGLINGGLLANPFLFPAPADPNGIALAQDGAYWIAQSNPSAVGRYATDGTYSKVADMPANSFPRRIIQGAGNTVWVLLERPGELFSRIARISGVEPPDTRPPTISEPKLTSKRFTVGKKRTALTSAKKQPKVGTTIKFGLDESATVTITIQRLAAGRVSRKNCVKPTSRTKRAKKCTRLITFKQTLTRNGSPGANSIPFSGRFGRTTLKPGKYRFSIVASDARGNSSGASTIKFSVLAKPGVRR